MDEYKTQQEKRQISEARAVMVQMIIKNRTEKKVRKLEKESENALLKQRLQELEDKCSCLEKQNELLTRVVNKLLKEE